MVNADPPMHAGGEYGDVRARIDEDKLNAYLFKNVPAVTVPVAVKQFKVRLLALPRLSWSHTPLSVWPGLSRTTCAL